MKILQKDQVVSLIKLYGFSDIDTVALAKFNIIVETLLFNIFENLFNVLVILKGKVITMKHVNIVMKLIHTGHNPKNIITGGTVLPPAFFDPSSTSGYFESAGYPDAASLAYFRPALVNTMTGGATTRRMKAKIIDEKYIRDYIEFFKEKTKKSFKISKDVIPVLEKSVLDNLELLLKECKTNKKTGVADNRVLTKAILFKTLKDNIQQFIHMSVVWK
jgi:hypothetical protein